MCDASVDGVYKLGRAQYYKYRAASLMFGFNTNITQHLDDFCEFNALRKNQLLAFYDELQPHVRECVTARRATNKYRDYYFMAQFEVGQRELVELHHYTYEIDLCALLGKLLSKANSKALAEGAGDGIAKVIFRKDTYEVISVHIVGLHAADLIQECSNAINAGSTLKDLSMMVHTHPTLCEVLDEAFKAGLGRSAH